MANLTRFDPFNDMISLRGAMDRLFDESFVNPLGWRIWNGESLTAPVDVHQTNDEIVVTASLPGIKGQTLTIRGEVHADEKVEREQYLYRERRAGTFSRTLELPVRVMGDRAEATFENGLLRLSIPKAEDVKPRQIQVKVPTSEKVPTK